MLTDKALDLISEYEGSAHGPLFMKPSAPGYFKRLDQGVYDLHVIDRAMLFLQRKPNADSISHPASEHLAEELSRFGDWRAGHPD